MNNSPDRVLITVGSKASFWLDIEDEASGLGVDLYQKTTSAIFCNCKGDKFVVSIDTNSDSARCGSLFIEIPSATTIDFDKNSSDFDIEYVDGADTIVIPVSGKIEIQKRNCP